MGDGRGRRDTGTKFASQNTIMPNDQLSQKQTLFLCPVGFPRSFLLHCCSVVCGRFESQLTLLLIGPSAIIGIDES